jgi:hypothetical protein
VPCARAICLNESTITAVLWHGNRTAAVSTHPANEALADRQFEIALILVWRHMRLRSADRRQKLCVEVPRQSQHIGEPSC